MSVESLDICQDTQWEFIDYATVNVMNLGGANAALDLLSNALMRIPEQNDCELLGYDLYLFDKNWFKLHCNKSKLIENIATIVKNAKYDFIGISKF